MGKFLLSINVPVYCWLLKREMEGLPPLQEVDNFCIVTEMLFEDYENCKDTLPEIDVMLPLNDLLVFFLEKLGIPVETVELFNQKFVKFPPYSVDQLCE